MLTRCLAALALAACVWSAQAAPIVPVKANDVWVMAGDSITAQRLHSNYIEAWYRTHYPELNLRFRNSGIGGNRTGNILQRFDYDIAAFKPTIVSIELGMNDVGSGENPALYIKEMKEIIAKIRAINAQPVLISSSPVNDGSLMDDWKSERCKNIHPYTEALKKLGQEENVPVIDQYHPLLTLWGKNKPYEEAATLIARIPALTRDPSMPGADALRAYAKAWQDSGKTVVSLGGDPVHPGPVGQYMMAAEILKGIGVDGLVSAATLKADGSVVAQEACKITESSAKDGVLTFTRLDDRTPWPLIAAAHDAAKLMPAICDMTRYMLTVTGLPEGKYEIAMDGKPVATVTAAELAAGCNLCAAPGGEIVTRATAIIGEISALQSGYNNNFRAASKAGDAAKLAEAAKAIDAQDAKIAELCKPKAVKFTVAPAK